MKTKIGVLGGIGPESSAEFYKRLILEIQNKGIINKNSDYPHIIINSIPAEDLPMEGSKINEYEKGIIDLESFGCDFIVIVCNTAYVSYNDFIKKVNIPIINLEDEVKNYFNKNNIDSFLVIGSSKTSKNLFNFNEIKKTTLNPDDEIKVDEIILKYNLGKDKENCTKELLEILSNYNYYNLLVACTELSTILKKSNIKFIDTMDILINSTINYWKN
ncbi:aspartate/glutamate racemase family protein [Candidatus Pacearchaeota archaeon]|nr:aspartate/glutamate racemase family protein [Candidatus Pacearchaeota archaeon]